MDRAVAAEPVVADASAGQDGEGVEALGVAVVADAEPPVSGQPGDRPFGLPAVAAQPLGRLDPAAGDADLDPAPGQAAAAAAVVVGLVGVDLAGPAAPPTAGCGHRGDVVQPRLEHGRDVGV